MTNPNMTAVTDADQLRLDRAVEVPGDPDEVAEALLTAGRELMETFGIRRLRMDDVARQAGYGRATLYRRFATRDDLVWAIVNREITRTLTDIAQRLALIPDLRDRVVEAFAVTIEEVRANALVRRLLQIEPDLLLPHLTTRGGGALDIGRSLMGRLLREARTAGVLRDVDIDVTADLLVRVCHSMLLTPQGPVGVDDPASLRAFARTFIADPLFRAPV